MSPNRTTFSCRTWSEISLEVLLGSLGCSLVFPGLKDLKVTSNMVPGTPNIDRQRYRISKLDPQKPKQNSQATFSNNWAELPPGVLPHPEGPDLAPGGAWGCNSAKILMLSVLLLGRRVTRSVWDILTVVRMLDANLGCRI